MTPKLPIKSVQAIKKLIQLAREINAIGWQGKKLGLSEAGLVLYDALGVGDSAMAVVGHEVLFSDRRGAGRNHAKQRDH